MVNNVNNASAVNYAYLTQVHHEPPAKPASHGPTETTPQEDKVQLSNAAKQSSGDLDHDGDRH
ncbi:MAG TPA: hypothetical protein VLX58_20675 [Bryobacteraceae bacterium]|nr:hypothetical protein [Bryobacteraceae bacterium]HUJ23967.1 hypothetical protein [Bryobacteraceae bacterium]